MRPLLPLLCLSVGFALPAAAIPNQIGGFLANVESPLNDTDLTNVLLAEATWEGVQDLPGTWRTEAPIGPVRSSWLAARPKVLGLPALMVQARHRDDRLDSVVVTFADAGSYFGYLDEQLPPGLSRRERQDELQRRLAGRQAEFTRHFEETRISLEESLRELSKRRPRESQIGKTRTLRAEVTDYQHEDLLLRMIVGGERLLRVIITPRDSAAREWLDADRVELSRTDRERLFGERVIRNERGDVRIDDLPVVPQGYKPYCGLNTLTMAARYFGLHLDEDWLAVAGQFQNSGSAAGSQIPRLYLAVAKEAGLDLHKSNDFSLDEARGALDRGLPVIVWRRFSHERNQVHTEETRQADRNPSYSLPAPDDAIRATWPDTNAPLHASVVVGYNQDRREVLFLESWAGMDTPRRMRAEELAATAYLTFYFKP